MGSSGFLLPMLARGVYREMLTQAWRRGAKLPNDHASIRRAIGCTDHEWAEAWPKISRYWRSDDQNNLVNDTQLAVYAEAKAMSGFAKDRARKAAQKRWGQSLSNAPSNAQAMLDECTPSPSPSPSLISESVSVSEKKKSSNGNGNGHADARSKRPIFTGQRLTVFEWMLDDCMQILGPLTDAFNLHEWFFTLDAQAAKASMVIPKRDSGAWLQAQLLAEAQRRNLPIASVQTKSDSLTASNVENAKRAIARITNRS